MTVFCRKSNMMVMSVVVTVLYRESNMMVMSVVMTVFYRESNMMVMSVVMHLACSCSRSDPRSLEESGNWSGYHLICLSDQQPFYLSVLDNINRPQKISYQSSKKTTTKAGS